MDRFIDEQENQALHRERPASPTTSLLMGDHKRHLESPVKTPTQEELAAVLEMVHKVVDPKTLSELVPDLSVPHIPESDPGLPGVSYDSTSHLASIFQTVDVPHADDEPASKRPRSEFSSPCSDCITNNVTSHSFASAFGASGHVDSSFDENRCMETHSAAYSSGPLTSEGGQLYNLDFSSLSGAPQSVTSSTFAL